MSLLALDIGGANLKASDGADFAVCRPFPLWKNRDGLAVALRAIVEEHPRYERIAVTMTGELADCYASKAEGVAAIVAAVVEASSGRSVSIYLTDGRFVSSDEATASPRLAAASNWHALARYACRLVRSESGLLVDIGSTTCDVIPLVAGRVAAVGKTDSERLAAGELVYTGVKRSPVCALIDHMWRNQASIPVAQEVFATAWDAYLLLDRMPEEPRASETADGRPATKQHARQRMARMVCADRDELALADIQSAAQQVLQAQRDLLHAALAQVLRQHDKLPETVITSGCGEFLAQELIAELGLDQHVVSLCDVLGANKSEVAPAYALAILANEELPS